jgi:SAM-dependent methyltransferase
MISDKKIVNIFSSETIYYNGQYYDLIVEGLVNRLADTQFWLESVRLYGSPVLELTCGTGRISTEISKEGFKVIGVDNSESMLSVARAKSLQVDWVNADVRDFDLAMKFPLIIFPYNALCHFLQEDELISCFRCIKNHLTHDGVLIIDIFNLSSKYLSILQSKERTKVSIFQDLNDVVNVVMSITRDYDEVGSIVTSQALFEFSGGKPNVIEEFQFIAYLPEKINSLLRGNGFSIENKYGDYKYSFFEPDSPNQIFVCKSL